MVDKSFVVSLILDTFTDIYVKQDLSQLKGEGSILNRTWNSNIVLVQPKMAFTEKNI